MAAPPTTTTRIFRYVNLQYTDGSEFESMQGVLIFRELDVVLDVHSSQAYQIPSLVPCQELHLLTFDAHA